MGRIDAVIPDSLEQTLRMEVVRRYGGKKGGLLRAVTEALEMWVQSDETKELAKSLAKTALDPKTQTDVKKEAVSTLGKMGSAGASHLAKIGGNHDVPEPIRIQALKAIESPGSR